MSIAHEIVPSRPKTTDFQILIGYAALAMILLIAIYLASPSSGTALGDFEVMTVFP